MCVCELTCNGHASSTKLLCSLDEQTTELISELPVMLKVEQAQLGVPSQFTNEETSSAATVSHVRVFF